MSDPLTIVVLPGLDGTGRLLRDFTHHAPPEWNVVVQSYDADEVRYDTLATRIIPTLPNHDFIILGESFSGPLAQRIALTHPKHLIGVIFAATFVTRPSPWPSWIINALWAVPFQSRWMLHITRPLFMGWSRDTALFDEFVDVMQSVPKATFIDRLKQVHRLEIFPVTATKRRLPVPSLFLRATRERFLSRRCGRVLAEYTDQTEPMDTPHFLLQTQPETAVKAIITFVDRIRSNAG